MDDEELFELLLAQWDHTAPEDRAKGWRDIVRQIIAHFRGREGRGSFLGAFLGEAHYDSDAERRQLWAIARQFIADPDDEAEEPDDGLLSARTLKEKRKASAAQRAATLARMNEKFCVVNEGGKVWIFADHYDAALRWQCWERMRQTDFLLMFDGENVCTTITSEGKATYQPVAKWWLGHAQRRTYRDGVMMGPREQTPDGVLNLWRGFGFEPRPGSWRRLKDHIRYVICAGEEYSFDYLMGWMARALQLPGLPGEVAIVLRGDPGAGKGILGHALRKLFGNHGLHVSQGDQLTGKFNAHLRECLFLFADEAFFVGDKAGMRVLRALITERVKTVEVKGGAVFQSPNMLHLMMASNERWVVPMIAGERRVAAFDVLDTFKGDFYYFKLITDELEQGGYAAMLDELLHYDLSTFEVRRVPETGALEEQREFTLSSVQAWWREVLERGYVYRSEMGLETDMHKWQDDASTELLYASYCQYVSKRRERFEQRGTIVRFLCGDLKCQKTRVRNLITGEHMTRQGPEVVRMRWPQTVRLGPLAQAREYFAGLMNIDAIDWPEPDETATDDVVVPLRTSDDEQL